MKTRLAENDIKISEEIPKYLAGVVGGHEMARSMICIDSLPKFQHINAETVSEAILLLRQYGERAAVIAGGIDLLQVLKSRCKPTRPDVLINIKSISKPNLSYIVEDDTSLKIGSLTSLHAIETSELIARRYGILHQAAHAVAGPQCRNMATLGGNICQEVKCWYYRASGNAFFCRRKGGNTCYALEGDNRYHAILGAACCFAVCTSDIAAASVALGANVKIAGIAGERTVPLERFFTPFGNIMERDELLTELEIPTLNASKKGMFLKFRLRNALDPAIVSVAMMAAMEDNVCNGARIVLGGVSPMPWLVVRANEVLAGKEITKYRAEGVAQLAVEGATPLAMNAYKIDLVRALVRRAVLWLGER